MSLPVSLPALLVAALLAGLALGGTAGWQIQGWRRDSADAERVQAEARDAFRRAERADGAAVRHETTRAAIRAQQQIITREVERVVESPVYRDVCLDAGGLQLVAQAAAAAASASQPAPAVPAASAPR